MNKSDVDDWLRRYIEAWKTYDRAQIGDLFTEDAEYRYHPYDEPETGRDAVVESWFVGQDPPGRYEADYEAVAVDGDVAVAAGSSTYYTESGDIEKIYDNIYLMRFADDGRCRSFTEWFMLRPSERLDAPRPG